ncbi:hypothetical protein FPSE5266_05316 [Fusarium pseudograminearum]|nr:hypothetical protein FPSE5266_05316 [Fusarium pseudograminearum]
MRSIETRRLAAFLALPFLCNGFTVTVDRDTTGKSIAQAIFNGPGLTLVNWDLRAPADSLGAFTDGPFGIGNGGILTTGQASGAMPGGDGNVDNGGDGADIFCGLGSTNAAVVYAGVTPGAGYNGIRIEFVFATNEPDGGDDSALLIKGYGCTDCESTPNGAEINYVKQTTTLERGEQPYTQTISASGTASGTFIYFVAPEETTTTMAAETTTADTTTTTAMAEDTTTTSAAADVPTDTTSSDGSTTINDETSFGSTTAMVTDPTTSTASGTTAEFTTTDEPTSTIESASEQTTTKRSPCRPRRHLH